MKDNAENTSEESKLNKETEIQETSIGQNTLYTTSLIGNSDNDESGFRQNPYLPKVLQQKAENVLVEDFSNVNIYKDSLKAKELGAKAFTQGNTIHFAPGKFNPYTPEGEELIAHELVHVAQQRLGSELGLSNIEQIMVAENQADLISDIIAIDSYEEFDLQPIRFNTIQLKPDTEYPPDLENLKFYYLVSIPHDLNYDKFKAYVAQQIYRNSKLNVDMQPRNEKYKGGKLIPVWVDIKTFVINTLNNEDLKLNENLFNQRKHLIHQYIYREWLKENENGSYTFKYLTDGISEKEIEAKQDDLIKQVRSIFESGQILRREQINIPSYNRSSYKFGYNHNPNEKKLDPYTSREKSVFIVDDILQHLPFEDSYDYFELRLQYIPNSNQLGRITLQYFYYDQLSNTYWPSEDYCIVEFDPYDVHSYKRLFTAKDNEIKIDYQYSRMGGNNSFASQQINLKLLKEKNKIKIINDKIQLNEYWQIKNGQLELIQPHARYRQKYREVQEIGFDYSNITNIERKFRLKKLYANERDHNAIKRLGQLRDYYKENNSYEKVHTDFNRFFVNANLSSVKSLDPSDQFTFMFLIQSLEVEKELTFDTAKDIFRALLDVYHFSLEGIEDVNDLESFKALLMAKQFELEKFRRDKEPRNEPNIRNTDIGDWLPPNLIHDAIRPFEINNLEGLLTFFVSYLDNHQKGKNYLKSALNELFSRRLINKSIILSDQKEKLETLRRAMNENDESKKLKILQEVIGSQSAGIFNDPWLESLKKAKSLNAFKLVLQEKPKSEITEFFNGLIDGSFLNEAKEAEKKTNELLADIGANNGLKRPIELLNNEVSSFLQTKDLDPSELIRINAVFYPGEEGIGKEALINEAIPLNLYTYSKNNERFVVLFFEKSSKKSSEKSKEYKNEVFQVASTGKEILTADVLHFIDTEKILGQGVLYYDDFKKFEGEENYSHTVSSYEFVTPTSIWEQAANITSGVVFIASLLAGPAGWARNGAFLMAMLVLSTTSALAVSINKYIKSDYRDLEGKDWMELLLVWGGLALDATEAANLMRLLRKGNAQDLLKYQQILKTGGYIENAQLGWGTFDTTYGFIDLVNSYNKGSVDGVDSVYWFLQFAFTVKSLHNKFDKPSVLRRAISSDFNISKSLEYSRHLNGDSEIALAASKEFNIALSYLSDPQIKNLRVNLETLKGESIEMYNTFLKHFGTGNLARQDYLLLTKMTHPKPIVGLKGEVKKHLESKGVPIENVQVKDIADPNQVIKLNEKIQPIETDINNNKIEKGLFDIEFITKKNTIELNENEILNLKQQLHNKLDVLIEKDIELKLHSAKMESNCKTISDIDSLIELKEKIARKTLSIKDQVDKQIDAFNNIGKLYGDKVIIESKIEKLDEQISLLNEDVIPGQSASINDKKTRLEEIAVETSQKTKSIELAQSKIHEKELQIKNLSKYSVAAEIVRIEKEMAQIDKKYGHLPLTPADGQRKSQLAKERNRLKLNPRKQEKKIQKQTKIIELEVKRMKLEENRMVEELNELKIVETNTNNTLSETELEKAKAIEQVSQHMESKTNLQESQNNIQINIGKLEVEIEDLKKQIGINKVRDLEEQNPYDQLEKDKSDAKKYRVKLEADLDETEQQIKKLKEKGEIKRKELLLNIDETNVLQTEIEAKILEGKKIQEDLNLLENQQGLLLSEKKLLDVKEKELYEGLSKLEGEFSKAEFKKLEQLALYEKSFAFGLLKNEVGFDLSFAKIFAVSNFFNSLFKIKDHQLKRLVRTPLSTENSIAYDEDFKNEVKILKGIISQTLSDLDEAKESIVIDPKVLLIDALNEELLLEKQLLQNNNAAQETLELLIEQLKYQITLLFSGESSGHLQKELFSAEEELNKLMIARNQIETKINPIEKVLVEINLLKSEDFNSWFEEKGNEKLSTEIRIKISQLNDHETQESLLKLHLIDSYIKELKSLANFLEINFAQGIQKTK